MTRNEVAAEYELSPEGIIKGPGKFDAEPLYAAALWIACLDGGCEELFFAAADTPVWLCPVEPADWEEWPDIPASTAVIALWGSPNGFVLSKALDKVEADRWRADAARAGK